MSIEIADVLEGWKPLEEPPANDASQVVLVTPVRPPLPPAGGFGAVGEAAEELFAGARTAEELCRVAKLDWTVRKQATRYPDGKESEDSFHLIRNDTGRELAVVGTGYGVAQNVDAFSTLDPLTKAGMARYIGAGGFDGGKTVFAQVSLGFEGEVVPGDVVRGMIAVRKGHGSTGIRGCQTMVRVACRNTLKMAMSGEALFATKHTRNVQKRLLEARAVIEELAAAWKRELAQWQALAKRQVQTDEALSVLKDLIKASSDGKVARQNAERQRDEVMELLRSGRGTDIPGVKGTAWGLLNAVTEWHDHTRTAEQGSEERLKSTLWGEASAAKETAYERILQTLDA